MQACPKKKKKKGAVHLKRIYFPMRGIFWNSRGLRDLAKRNFLHDLSLEKNLDFIALLETYRRDFSDELLNSFCGNREFTWKWNPPNGRSGGILVGFNSQNFILQNQFHGEFFVKLHLKNKCDGYRWALVAVYGAAQHEHKDRFLAEFVNTCSTESLPLMVGGDFNIIRNPSEKNNDRYNSRWPLLFNACIETLNLRELELSGRKFTWANSAEHPTFERLDRILVSTDWEQKFPLSTVEALTREISDHTPLLLDTNQASHKGNTPLFKFELGWLAKDGFFDLITNVWKAENRGTSPLQRWQNKIRTVRRYLRGWAKNQVGQNKKKEKFPPPTAGYLR